MAGLGAIGRPALRPRCTALDRVAPAASAHRYSAHRYDAYGRCARRSPWCMGFCPSVPHPGVQCLGAGIACGLGQRTGDRHGPGPAAPGRSGAWGFARAFHIPGCSAWGQASHADLDSAPDIGTDLGRRRRGVQVHGVLPATMRADMNWSRQRRCILTVHGVLPATKRIGAAWEQPVPRVVAHCVVSPRRGKPARRNDEDRICHVAWGLAGRGARAVARDGNFQLEGSAESHCGNAGTAWLAGVRRMAGARKALSGPQLRR